MSAHRLSFRALPLLALTLSCAPAESPRDAGPSDPPATDAGTPGPAAGSRDGACYGNGTCDASLVCVDGRCADEPDEPGALGGPCYGNGTCNESLTCLGGVCAIEGAQPGALGGACYGNGTCDAGLECRENLCREPPAGVGGAGQPCLSDGTCNDELVCTAGLCRVPDGGGGGGGDAGVPPAEMILGAAGGTVEYGRMTLTIPPGALLGDTTIRVSVMANQAPPGYVAHSPVYRFEPEGTTFAMPATVSIRREAGGTNRSALYWTRQGAPGYERLVTTTEGDRASALVQHFSAGFYGELNEGPLEERPVDCMNVDVQQASTYNPAAVRAAFVVRHCDGVPMVQDLDSQNIAIVNSETDAPFNSSLEGGGASAPARLSELLSGPIGSAPTLGLYAVLSLDFSNSIVDSGAAGNVVDAAQGFVDALVRDTSPQLRYRVAIQVFGRSDATRIVQPFTNDYATLTAALNALRNTAPLGTTNLYGAYQQALSSFVPAETVFNYSSCEGAETGTLTCNDDSVCRCVDGQWMCDQYRCELGIADADILGRTVVLVTDGRHEAGDFDAQRAQALAARDAAAAAGIEVYSVAVNAPPVDLPFLAELATEPSYFDALAAISELEAAFERASENLRRLPEATYIVGICTPVELGTARFKVRVTYEGITATGEGRYDASDLNGNVAACEPARVVDPCGTAVCGEGYLEGYSCGECEDQEFCEAGSCSDLYRLIPAGTFMMGTPEGELGNGPSVAGQVQVRLTRNFYMQAREVTQLEFKQLVGYLPTYNGGANFYCDNCPVFGLRLNDFSRYINALNEREGYPPCSSNTAGYPYTCAGYRLPTHAEWEYAARAGTTTATYAGNLTALDCTDTTTPAIARTSCTSFVAGGRYSFANFGVGQFQPNAWGLYDMIGNVAEQVSDPYYDYVREAGEPSPMVDPYFTPPGVTSTRLYSRGCDIWNQPGHCTVGRVDESIYSNTEWQGDPVGIRLVRTAP